MDSPDPTAPPIPPHLFALALTSLPLDALYAKATELHNSISHLLSSNIAMKPYADDGDDVCREAIVENDVVITRMEERVRLVREEVQGRGQRWSEHGEDKDGLVAGAPRANGVVNGDGTPVAAATAVGGQASDEGATRTQRSGRLTDEELRRQLEAQMSGGADDEDDGVHL